jgi:hypothetical protein
MAVTDILGGAVTIGRSFLQPTRAVDVVSITGGGFATLFSSARPMRAEVLESAALMEHPLETGALIADHIVFDPIEIELPVIIVGESEYRNTYALIKAAFTAGTLLTVVTRTGSYPNMVLAEIPHEERPDAFNAIAMRIRLREAHFVTPQSGALTQSQTKDAKQSSTVSRGAQQTTGANASQSAKAGTSYGQSGAGGATNPQGSTLYRWYNGT